MSLLFLQACRPTDGVAAPDAAGSASSCRVGRKVVPQHVCTVLGTPVGFVHYPCPAWTCLCPAWVQLDTHPHRCWGLFCTMKLVEEFRVDELCSNTPNIHL